MAEFDDRTFGNGERVETDGNVFNNCRFQGASLVYAGGEHPQFNFCNLEGSGWYFTGGALRTIQFLQIINNSPGGKEFVASLFVPDQMLTE
jgi:hypothetical protein